MQKCILKKNLSPWYILHILLNFSLTTLIKYILILKKKTVCKVDLNALVLLKFVLFCAWDILYASYTLVKASAKCSHKN